MKRDGDVLTLDAAELEAWRRDDGARAALGEVAARAADALGRTHTIRDLAGNVLADFEPRITQDELNRLRTCYGEAARFSFVAPHTLVHLDAPADAVVAQRVTSFDPSELFKPDCPLCETAVRAGGHVVFDDSRASKPIVGVEVAGRREDTPAARFARAFTELEPEVDAFGRGLDASVPTETARGYSEAVGTLSDNLVDVLWAENAAARRDGFEQILGRAEQSIDAVVTAAPHLAGRAASLRGALARVAEAWREL